MFFFNSLAHGFQGKDGDQYFMWMILLCGVGVLGILIERIYYLFFVAGGGEKFMAGLSAFIKKGEFDKALKYAESFKKMPLALSISAVLRNRSKGTKAIQKAVDEVFITEVPKMSRYIALINVIANVATLVGLAGTIFGLMISFDAVANAPAAQRATLLAKGISVVMSSTLFGLVVAVPALVIQGLIMTKSDSVIEQLDEKTTKFINLVEE